MRIIAGSARGRRLLSVPKDMPLRPISDRIKQSLFDILRPRVPGSRFLDLFAGTGAVGLEALSRGAECAVFVDLDARCLRVIERNLERTGWSGRGRVFRGNALASLSWVPYRSGSENFDLIFLGPPYKDEAKRSLSSLRLTQTALGRIATAGLLAPEGWVAAQHHKKESVSAPEGLEFFRESRYGDTMLRFFRRPGVSRSPLAS